jgi:Cytochrome b5-like Heme/Steroid binding domain
MNLIESVKYTTIVNKYPKNRDALFRGCWRWLESRRADDGAEDLWRVHDKLYDLKGFAQKHPGGKEWIVLTKVLNNFQIEQNFQINIKCFQGHRHNGIV